MKIGKGSDCSMMIYVEVDLARNTELTGNFLIPTKESIIEGVGTYFSSPLGNRECVRLYRYEDYYVDWNGKIYHVDSPEKYDVLVNIISTEFALARLE